MDSQALANITLKYPSTFPVFFIGTSGQGVKALEFLAANIPENFPSPFFFLLHRQRKSIITKHLLLEILSSKSILPVVIPETDEEIVPGTIYLPAYSYHLTVRNNKVFHSKEPADEYWRPSIDVLFKSGAKAYKDRAVSALLTGDLDDGVAGLRETTYQGGITIAQSPDDAYNPVLPLNAILGDHPQYVVPLEDMPALFCELAGFECFEDQEKTARKAAIAAAMEKEKNKE